MRCKFCDCPKFGYHGNVSLDELCYEIETIINNEDIDHTERFNVRFARMGEPTFNNAVLDFAEYKLREVVKTQLSAKTIHPVVSTMLPKSNRLLEDFIMRWCNIKNKAYNTANTKLHKIEEVLADGGN